MPTTIFSKTLTSQGSNGTNVTYRQFFTTTGASQGQVRATIPANSALQLQMDHVSIALLGGATPPASQTPVELLFAGGHGTTVSAGSSKVSDWVNFSVASGARMCITADLGATGGAGPYVTPGATNEELYAKTGAGYTDSTGTGYADQGSFVGIISLLETQPAGQQPYDPWHLRMPILAQRVMVGWRKRKRIWEPCLDF